MKHVIISLLLLSLLLGTAGCLIPLPQEVEQPPLTETPVNSSSAAKPIDSSWSPSTTEHDAVLLPSIADVVDKAYPSVVTISTEVVVLDLFLRPRTQSGAGSGWIIDKNGIIATNNHVIEGAKKVTIELADGRTFQAEPDDIKRDPLTDIAVIKINATGLPNADIGDSMKLRVGEWVVALGNPLGQGLRAKEGTISGLKVSLPSEQGQTLYDLIETSAAINPGNSGGPLVNMKGQVIGITSAKIAAVGVEGMGYAISSKTAMSIIKELITKGYVTRPWLGVQLYTVDQYVATVNNLSVNKGAIITYMSPVSPAIEAELKELDVIIRFQDKDIATAEDLIQAIHSSEVGQTVKITYVRGEDTKITYATLIQSPPPQ